MRFAQYKAVRNPRRLGLLDVAAGPEWRRWFFRPRYYLQWVRQWSWSYPRCAAVMGFSLLGIVLVSLLVWRAM